MLMFLPPLLEGRDIFKLIYIFKDVPNFIQLFNLLKLSDGSLLLRYPVSGVSSGSTGSCSGDDFHVVKFGGVSVIGHVSLQR
ncbi:hypothetical protein DY000_02023012 [Brassica cretica]|uniref:Uncharacterized protein n=1 Tax=Brassica cretica TaxID=69181 RepID=A0ABQ7E4U1_BRACR|nr:hypothetical protein DY000_02023012 [Brassica cretica]